MVRVSVVPLILVLLLSSLLVVPGGVAQADAERAHDEDAPGDVSAYGPAGPLHDVPLPTPFAPPVDLVGAWIGDETPTRISFGLEVADMARPQATLLQGVSYALCFERSATDSRYVLIAQLGYGNAVEVGASVEPELQRLMLKKIAAQADAPADAKGCDVFGAEVVDQLLTEYQLEVDFRPDEDRLQVDVPRELFTVLGGAADGTGGDPLPQAGETFRLVKAFASHKQGPATVHYDETPGDKAYTLRSDTGNRGLVVSVTDSIGYLFPGRATLAVPVYGVEIGGLQAVPFNVRNLLGEAVDVDLTVDVVAGDQTKWRFHHLDEITLPAGDETAPGNETLTLVVSGDPTLGHKERVRLLIRATTAASDEALGVGIVDVMGVVPPTEDQPRLFFHNDGATCNTNAFWVNTLKSDGGAATTPFVACPYQQEEGGTMSGFATVGDVARVFKPDVPFQRDYVLDTSAAVPAEIALKAVHRAGRAAEVPFAVKADVVVQVLAGGSVIGQGRLVDQEVKGEGSVLSVPVDYYGELMRPDRRVIEDGTRLEVRIVVASDTRTIVTGGYCIEEHCIPEREDQVGPPPARIEMLLDASSLALPIRESRSSSPYIDMRESGALLSLRDPEGPQSAYINPGKDAVRSLDVRNEGLNKDTAVLGAVLTVTRTIQGTEELLADGGGWKIAFLPKARFDLDRGERASVDVQVSAPQDAQEGDRIDLQLTATSGVDEGMVVRTDYVFLVTESQEIDDEGSTKGPPDDKKDTPAPSLAILLAALAALGVAVRRRRT